LGVSFREGIKKKDSFYSYKGKLIMTSEEELARRRALVMKAKEEADKRRGTFWNSTPSSSKGREIAIKGKHQKSSPAKIMARARARRRRII
jgi:hypothetical protein